MSLLPVWFKGLTPELEEKAELELNETPQSRAKGLAELKALISDENYLLRFLRVKKFNTENAFRIIRNNHFFKIKHDDLFRKPSQVKKVLDMNCVNFMPYRTPDGAHVTHIRLGNFNTRVANFEDLIAFYIICGELITQCEVTQIAGLHCIVDCRNITLQHYTMFVNVSFVKFTLSSSQECFAQRVNGLHFIHQPLALTTIIHLIRPFVKKKLLERVYMHGNDMKSLHKHIPEELLTQELGGTLEPLDDREFASYFMQHEEFIYNINQYGKLNI